MNNQEITQRINEALENSRADVLMEYLAQMVGTPGWPTHKELVSIAVFCARHAYLLAQTDSNAPGINYVIETVELWLKNPCEETREKMLNAANDADTIEIAADDVHVAFAFEAANQAAYYAAIKEVNAADADIVTEVITDTIEAAEINVINVAGYVIDVDAVEVIAARDAEHKAICDHIRQTVKIPI